MIQVKDVCDWLDRFAPPDLAEDWDNVGLIVGDESSDVTRLMTCLTITPSSCQEAVTRRAELVVTHHPLPFRPVKRLTRENTPASLLLDLIGAGVAVYSPHTAFDSASGGINQMLAAGLGCGNIRPLTPDPLDPARGSGRLGELDVAVTLAELASRLGSFLSVDGMHHVGSADDRVKRIAFACGSGGSFLAASIRAGCQLLITGEATFHTCLEAEANGIAMLLPGHYASERFAVETLAEQLGNQFSKLQVWASADERDPLIWRRTQQ